MAGFRRGSAYRRDSPAMKQAAGIYGTSAFPPQQLRQLADVRGDPPRLAALEQLGRPAPSSHFVLETSIIRLPRRLRVVGNEI